MRKQKHICWLQLLAHSLRFSLGWFILVLNSLFLHYNCIQYGWKFLNVFDWTYIVHERKELVHSKVEELRECVTKRSRACWWSVLSQAMFSCVKLVSKLENSGAYTCTSLQRWCYANVLSVFTCITTSTQLMLHIQKLYVCAGLDNNHHTKPFNC